MKVLRVFVDQDILMNLGDGREVRLAFKGSKREGNGLIRGSIGIHAPQSVGIRFAEDVPGKTMKGCGDVRKVVV